MYHAAFHEKRNWYDIAVELAGPTRPWTYLRSVNKNVRYAAERKVSSVECLPQYELVSVVRYCHGMRVGITLLSYLCRVDYHTKFTGWCVSVRKTRHGVPRPLVPACSTSKGRPLGYFESWSSSTLNRTSVTFYTIVPKYNLNIL